MAKNIFRVLSMLVTIFFVIEQLEYGITDPMTILIEITPWLVALQIIKLLFNGNIGFFFIFLLISSLHYQMIFIAAWGGFLLTFVYMFMDYRRWKNKKVRSRIALQRAIEDSHQRKLDNRGNYANLTTQELTEELSRRQQSS